jgi:hypothetical protein
MQLTSEMLSELTRTLRAASVPNERRRDARISFQGYTTIVLCAPKADKRPRHVEVRDVSETSIAIVVDTPMKVGEQFIVCLPSSQDHPRSILCAVARWQPIDQRQCLVAATFVQQLSVGLSAAMTGAEIQELHQIEQRLNNL